MKTSNHLPLVSIGVPAYNGGKYLEECLDSIRNQSYSNWECIICNNSSTDRTPEIAERYVQLDPRFKLFHTTELLPITDSWNYCFSKISPQSDYVKLLPADDWLFPDFISEMVEIMENHSDLGICSSYRLVDMNVEADGLDIYHGNRFSGKEILIRQLKGGFDVTSCINSVLYRMDTLKNLRNYPKIFQDEPFHQDTFLAYELLMRSDLGFVFKVLSYTRRHNESVTSTVADELRTTIYFREFAQYHYRTLDPSILTVYKKTRIHYAYFLLKSRLLGKKDLLNWHRKRLMRPIKFKEYCIAVLKRVFNKKVLLHIDTHHQ